MFVDNEDNGDGINWMNSWSGDDILWWEFPYERNTEIGIIQGERNIQCDEISSNLRTICGWEIRRCKFLWWELTVSVPGVVADRIF